MARLLIVDDEKSLCQVLKIALRKNGHLVETASSGQAAKKKIESRVFDLIISDIRMPDLRVSICWSTPTRLITPLYSSSLLSQLGEDLARVI